jgi:secreted PhoX family phosphatase
LNKPSITYASDGGGGTTNVIFDAKKGRWLKSWSSLAGTVRNCAGGVTPWGTWITGEETIDGGHGWCFDVGAQKGDPTALAAMGRFSHEAMMVDALTGYVYETEDSPTPISGFYKFVPNVYGKLKEGGDLFMLKVKGHDNFNFAPVGNAAWPVGSKWDVEWVRIEDPLAGTVSTVNQGVAGKCATFRRLEGCWWGNFSGYFLSTNGGPAGEGQVFEYTPVEETLKLIYVSPTFNDLDNPDNITVTPRGGLLLCEDAAGNNFTAGERLVGLTLTGNTFTFGQNNINLTAAQILAAGKTIAPGPYQQNEWAGACYSPDGKWLFVNIQTPGVTFAITGPWHLGPL